MTEIKEHMEELKRGLKAKLVRQKAAYEATKAQLEALEAVKEGGKK